MYLIAIFSDSCIVSIKGCFIRMTLCHDIAAHVVTRTKTCWHATRVRCHSAISFLSPSRSTLVEKTMPRERIVVRAVLPLSCMATFWIQNAAMRDDICRDRIIIAAFSDYTMRSRLHNRYAMLCQCSPPTQCAPPLCQLLHHLLLHARRGITEGMGASLIARRRPCRRVIAPNPGSQRPYTTHLCRKTR
jgi:hypothetical protein